METINKMIEKVKEIAHHACIVAVEIQELHKKLGEHVPDTNVGSNGWIPVSERNPMNTDNVRVTAQRDNGKLETAIGYREPYQSEGTENFSKRTNADRIRAMTNEELADAIFKNSSNTFGEVIPFCNSNERCVDMLDSCDGIPESMCRECLLEWLKKPEGGVSG